MKKKDIAFIVPFIPRKSSGGVAIILQYAEALVHCGHSVTIYFQARSILKKLKMPSKIRKYMGKLKLRHNPNNWYKLNEEIQKKSIMNISEKEIGKHDAVIATEVSTSWPVARLPKECGEKFYLIQDFENWVYEDKKVLSSYRLGMNNIVVSKWLFDVVKMASGRSPKYISNGIDTNIFKVINPISERKRHSLIFQYREDEFKGGKYAISVINKLKRLYSDLEVYIISRETKSSEIPEWCNYIYDISLKDVATYNNKASVFICTSIEEGFGLPGLEAMACGCALCTTDYQGGMEYAVNGKNSLVSPVKDVDAMVRNVQKIFEDDKLKYRIVAKGLETVKAKSMKNSKRDFVEYVTSKIDF